MLLPFRLKIFGYILLVAGMISSFLRFGLKIKPELLEIKVFAVHSSIFKTYWLSGVTNNISEEICAVLLLTGLFIIAFSEEKTEKKEYAQIRLQSALLAFYLEFIFLLLAIIFIFGLGFITILVLNMFTQLLFYIVILKINLLKYDRRTL